jgi:hypothetical protein
VARDVNFAGEQHQKGDSPRIVGDGSRYKKHPPRKAAATKANREIKTDSSLRSE